MTGWLARHWHTFWLIARRLARTPFATLLTAGVIGIALSLPVGFYALLANLGQAAGGIAAEPQITLFLSLDAGAGEVRQIEARLKQHAGVRSARFVPRAEALRELAQNAGLEDVAAGIERNPLPDAFVVNAADATADALEQLRREMQKWPGVEIAQLDSAWAKRLDALLELGRKITLILAALLSFALIAISGNTIRLQILTQREEIEVSKLIGATNRFIRLPFLYQGALQGLAGGAAAWLIVTASLGLLNGSVAELAAAYGSTFRLQPLSPGGTASLLMFSAGLGWIGAFLAVGHYLRRLEASSQKN